MKVLVDTSAWVDFFNGHPSKVHAALAALIAGQDEICSCGVVVAEVFQGLRRDKGRKVLQGLFRSLVFLEPASIDLYFRAADLYRSLRGRGIAVRSTIDFLIAALAEVHGCVVLSRDRDLETILRSGLLKARLFPLPE